MHRLVVNPGSAQAWEIELKPGTNSIGRNAANDFTIEDPSVSGRHCQIIVDEDSVLIKDLGSTNGTFVNGKLVEEAHMEPNESVRLGNVELLFQVEAPEPSPTRFSEDLRDDVSSHSHGIGEDVARALSTAVVSAPVTAAAEADKPIFCKNHYKNPGRYSCPKCRRFFCDLCVNTRGSSSGGLKFCKVCGSECSPVSVQAHLPKTVNFFRAVPQSFKYPFVGDGLILLFGGTIFFGFLDAANYISRHAFMYGMRAMTMRAVIFTFILGTGYLFAFLKKVIYASAEGDEQMPDWPELSEWQADIVSPMFQFVVISVLSFGPALAVQIWSDGDYPWLVWLVAVLGCFYFPMAFLGVAMFDSLAALNPLFILGSILKVPREYLVAALVFAGIVGLRWLSETALGMLLRIPLAPALFADLLGLGLLIIEARILGLLYLSQKAALGWFRKP